jgi:long-chain acyl-CoA synthetase
MENPKTWHPQARNYKTPPFTVDVPNSKPVKGETVPRRNVKTKDKLAVFPEEGVQTIFDIVRFGAAKYGNAKALGHRNVIKTHNEVKKIKKMVDGKEEQSEKTMTYSELSGYNYMTFIEYERMVLQAGSGLRKLGMNKSDRLHLFAATR